MNNPVKSAVSNKQRVTKHISIHGSPEQVFDLVTTAKYWPEWHPATIAVSGAVDAPMQLGDRIRERARIGGVVGEADWRVVERVRPLHVVLQVLGTALGDVIITYQFAPRGDEVEFTRELEFDLSQVPLVDTRAAIERQMETDSIRAVQQLKKLVERLIEEKQT